LGATSAPLWKTAVRREKYGLAQGLTVEITQMIIF
jgi:hypothetical protein